MIKYPWDWESARGAGSSFISSCDLTGFWAGHWLHQRRGGWWYLLRVTARGHRYTGLIQILCGHFLNASCGLSSRLLFSGLSTGFIWFVTCTVMFLGHLSPPHPQLSGRRWSRSWPPGSQTPVFPHSRFQKAELPESASSLGPGGGKELQRHP